MDHQVCLVFICLGFGIISCLGSFHRKYHYVTQNMNWADAQTYCREKYSDLATFESMEDIKTLSWPHTDNILMWIGLYDDPNSWVTSLGNDSNSWRWSATETPGTTVYHKWAAGQPNYDQGRDLCVRIRMDKTWTDTFCTEHRYAVCYTEISTSGLKQYHLVEQSLTWEQAKVYCRERYKDLAVIENEEENMRALPDRAFGGWIGLYRIPWRWSDGSNSSFKNWLPEKPDANNYNEHCVAEDSNHKWNDKSCFNKYGFICQEDLEIVKKTVVRMKIKADGDFSDPAALKQALLTTFDPTGIKMEIKLEEEEEQQSKEEAGGGVTTEDFLNTETNSCF